MSSTSGKSCKKLAKMLKKLEKNTTNTKLKENHSPEKHKQIQEELDKKKESQNE